MKDNNEVGFFRNEIYIKATLKMLDVSLINYSIRR